MYQFTIERHDVQNQPTSQPLKIVLQMAGKEGQENWKGVSLLHCS